MFDIHIGTISKAMEKNIANTLMIALAMKKNNTNITSLSSIVNPFIKSQKVGVEPTLIVLETTVLP